MTLLLKVTYIPKLSALTSTLVFQTFHAFWHIDQHQQWKLMISMYVLKNNCCIFVWWRSYLGIILLWFAIILYWRRVLFNSHSKPISTWGTSIPNIFFQGIICVCKYNRKSVLEKKMFNCIFMAKVRLWSSAAWWEFLFSILGSMYHRWWFLKLSELYIM